MGSNQGLHNYTNGNDIKLLITYIHYQIMKKNMIGINRKGKIKFRLEFLLSVQMTFGYLDSPFLD